MKVYVAFRLTRFEDLEVSSPLGEKVPINLVPDFDDAVGFMLVFDNEAAALEYAGEGGGVVHGDVVERVDR